MNKPENNLLIVSIYLLTIFASGCTQKYSYKENAVPEQIKSSDRLNALFESEKLICFGRYAINVPEETELTWGTVWFPSTIRIFRGGSDRVKDDVAHFIDKLKWKDETAEITYNEKGPIEDSWQLRYYEDDLSKKYKLHFFQTYVTKGDLTFVLGDSVEDETEDSAVARQATRARNLRLRVPNEVPFKAGYCIEHAFLSDATYAHQEKVNAGIYLPSFPDVRFSISSNKNAYGDYSPEEFDQQMRAELSLLARIEQAKKDQGSRYPSRTLLREGKRDVQHWHGEESLVRRADGVHDFEWAFVGTPKDVANPSSFNVKMYTKVEHNTVGKAKAASLSDDEAVALWDKLLSGLKFRVKVPNAPEGSYYMLPGQTDSAGK